MKSGPRGKSTSLVEIVSISARGFGLSLPGQELFLSFEHFPWFRNIPVSVLSNVDLVSSDHLYWPELDVDLSVESILHPEMFPLVSEVQPHYREAEDSGKRALNHKKDKPAS